MITYYAHSLGLSLSNFQPTILCHDCQDIVDEIYTYPLHEGNEVSLCAACFDHRVRIERRILDLIDDVGSTRQKIFTDLEELGIDSKRSNEALQRLLRCRRLREGDPR